MGAARFWTLSMRYSSRAESSVEMKGVEISILQFPGYPRGGGSGSSAVQLPAFKSTRYSMIVSP